MSVGRRRAQETHATSTSNAQANDSVGYALALVGTNSDATVSDAADPPGLHRKQDNGLNIWMCEVAGPRKVRRLRGYLLLDGHTIFSDLPPDNPCLKLPTPTVTPKTNAA